jgi:hypothetical protein
VDGGHLGTADTAQRSSGRKRTCVGPARYPRQLAEAAVRARCGETLSVIDPSGSEQYAATQQRDRFGSAVEPPPPTDVVGASLSLEQQDVEPGPIGISPMPY